jgi:predicted metal-dependent hydrolase
MNTDIHTIKLNELEIEVVRKEIKNVHLSVYPPNGRVKVSAPRSMSLDTLRVYLISKLGWIKKQQAKLRAQEREAPREYLDRESHYFKGKRYLLKVIEHPFPKVELKPDTIELYIRPGTSRDKRHHLVSEWYRKHLKKSIPPIIGKYEKLMGVEVKEFGVKKMRTKWGTCNPDAQRIWLNLELAKKPAECLEYIIVHEMAHLIERTHNDRFIALMNKYMPKWKFYRDELNRLPVSHVDWGY